MNIFNSNSASETKALGKRIGRFLKAGDVVALMGELGTGKTTLVKGIAQGLRVPRADEAVVSPTFALINEYEGREKVTHMDWYRLESVKGADRQMALEYFDSPAVTLVEWADKAKEILPDERLEIRLKHAGGNRRVLNLSAKGERYEDLLRQIP